MIHEITPLSESEAGSEVSPPDETVAPLKRCRSCTGCFSRIRGMDWSVSGIGRKPTFDSFFMEPLPSHALCPIPPHISSCNYSRRPIFQSRVFLFGFGKLQLLVSGAMDVAESLMNRESIVVFFIRRSD